MAEKIRERTKIDEGTRTKLQSFFEIGMTRVASPLVEEASAATGLDISIIENWIGNYKKAFKSTLKDVRQWSSLGQEDRERYKQEAAALKASTKPQDFSPGMRALKIKRHIKQLKLEASKLEELGVETAALCVDCLDSMTSVMQVASKNAAAFLEETDTANKFALKMSASCCSPSPVESVHDLVKKVQDLFNQKYIAAGGSGRLPYQALANQTLLIEMQGLPTDLPLRKPSFYGRKQLEIILKAADKISFQITEDAGTHGQTVEEIFASMFDDDFYDIKKNSKKKWRSWSQCSMCSGWSHTACGFKRNMCAKCQQ
ncbi:uncharacterized protein LOC143316315 [Chaetodon auriga]|uniref:uncharacterized protein LOC143316315 n=1 Tax=Chaetodon auriga TaxID=39042 RepID=UPI0040328CDF